MSNIKNGTLSDITILDFTWVPAGPHATKNFCDLGAEVIKVEMYKRGAAERNFPYHITLDGVTQSSYSINVNRGKKSVCINLKHKEGIDIIHGLIRESDIVIENFAPGVMERLGLEYNSVRKIKDDIIYCSISCFGQSGPYHNKPGYDIIAQSASGWIGQTYPANQAPVAIGDLNASMHATTAILSALHYREKTGIGQHIDISMVDCLFSLHENSLPWHFISSAVDEAVSLPKVSRHHPGYSPYGVYSGKDGDIVIALITDLRWEALVDTMGPGYEWLKTDSRVNNVAARCTTHNAQLVHGAVEKWVMSQESVEVAEKKLEEAGIPCLRVRDVVELAEVDPHIKARDMVVMVDQPFIGTMKMYGSPMKFSATSSCVRGHAPLLGEHNKEVLSEKLGYSSEDIEKLYTDDVLYHESSVSKLSA